MSKLVKPNVILFDWDNTLVDSWGKMHLSINTTLEHFSLPKWSLTETKVRMHKSLKDYFPELFGSSWLEAKEVYYNKYRALLATTPIQALQGVEGLIKKLHNDQVILGIVSNKLNTTLRLEVESSGWANYFSVVIGSTDAAKDKPHPEPVYLALSKLNQKTNVWFVGDTMVDIECAVNSGCHPILFGTPVAHNTDYQYHHVNNHEELLALYRKIVGI